MKHLHPDDHELFYAVKSITREYALVFDLKLKSVKPMKLRNAEGVVGTCSKDGQIRIRLRASTDGKWDKKRDLPYQIVDTIAHELAHLLHQKHRNEWFKMHGSILYRLALDGVLDRIRKLCDQ